MSTNFEGIYPYLVSPVDEQGNVMVEVLERLVNHLIDCGVHGLTPLGSTGEFFYLTWEQKFKIVETVVRAANHRVPVIAGVACSNTAEAIWQTKEFEKLGADGILGVLNVYFPLQQNSIIEYYRDLAASTELPVVVYNNPKFSGFELTVDTLKKLSEIPNIEYYKDASFNTGRLYSVINEVGSKLKVFSASAHIPTFVMQMGGVGWMSGPACLIPRQSVRLFELCKEKKMGRGHGTPEEALGNQYQIPEIQSCRVRESRTVPAGIRCRKTDSSNGAAGTGSHRRYQKSIGIHGDHINILGYFHNKRHRLGFILHTRISQAVPFSITT